MGGRLPLRFAADSCRYPSWSKYARGDTNVEAVEYEKLAQYERWYWWYRAQREWVLDILRRIDLPIGARVLDAGCGTGQTIEQIARTISIRGFGLDYSAHAARHWPHADHIHRYRASVNELPHPDNTFDAVLSVDVLQADEVRPRDALCELSRVIAPGGWLVLMVPAFDWMRSRHDQAVHCVRRFNKQQLGALTEGSGLRIEKLAYLFELFFPAIAAVRLLTRHRGAANGHAPRSDLAPLPDWLNRFLLALARAERRVLHGAGGHFGSTLLMIAGKAER